MFVDMALTIVNQHHPSVCIFNSLSADSIDSQADLHTVWPVVLNWSAQLTLNREIGDTTN